MAEYLFLKPIPQLAAIVEPYAFPLHLPTLPLHIQQVAAAAILYSVIFWPLSPWLSRRFFPLYYRKLSPSRRLNWDAHVVSLVQSVLINIVALWGLYADNYRHEWMTNSRELRVWGYTPLMGSVQGLATGYFVWDLYVSARHFSIFGPGTLAHAISALTVYTLGFRPFANYYSSIFILWELSTPFLNIHWFLDKMNLTGTRLQLYNGILLIFSFFTCRLLYGNWQSYRIMSDIWLTVQQGSPSSVFWAKNTGAVADAAALHHHATSPAGLAKVTSFISEATTVPVWLASAYTVSNLILNSLNLYWFIKMIQAVAKRFVPSQTQPPPTTKVPLDLGVPTKAPDPQGEYSGEQEPVTRGQASTVTGVDDRSGEGLRKRGFGANTGPRRMSSLTDPVEAPPALAAMASLVSDVALDIDEDDLGL